MMVFLVSFESNLYPRRKYALDCEEHFPPVFSVSIAGFDDGVVLEAWVTLCTTFSLRIRDVINQRVHDGQDARKLQTVYTDKRAESSWCNTFL